MIGMSGMSGRRNFGMRSGVATMMLLTMGGLAVSALAAAGQGVTQGSAQSSNPAGVPWLAANSMQTSGGSAAVNPVRGVEASGEAGSDGTHVGVKVHGWWVIDVRNPDGTLVEHREFENALTGPGGYLLGAMLAGEALPGDYGILLFFTGNGNGPCQGSGNQDCLMVRSLTTQPGVSLCVNAYCSTGLTTAFAAGTNSLTLKGSIVSNLTGSIGVVSTYAGYCYAGSTAPPTTVETNAPSTCAQPSGSNPSTTDMVQFTQAGLSPVMTVTSGQIIQVTVVISFA